MPKIICIYKLISPSGKVYVGQTRNFTERMRRYARMRCVSQSKLYAAIKKYGWETFTIEIIERYDNISQNALNAAETHYIKQLDCVKNGYNCCPCGGSAIGFKMTDESRQKIATATKAAMETDLVKMKLKDGIAKYRSTITPEQSSACVQKGWASMSAEDRLAKITRFLAVSKTVASMLTPEQRAAIEAKRVVSWKQQQRSSFKQRVLDDEMFGIAERDNGKWRVILKKKSIGTYETKELARAAVLKVLNDIADQPFPDRSLAWKEWKNRPR